MKESTCEICGDTFEFDWEDKEYTRTMCRQCEEGMPQEEITNEDNLK